MNHAEVERYLLPQLQNVHVNDLRWDSTRSWGQIRALNTLTVEKYKASLKAVPPAHPVRVLLRDMGSGVTI